MKKINAFLVCWVIPLVVFSPPILNGQVKKAGKSAPALKLQPPKTTSHSIMIKGKKLVYDATVGYLEQNYETGKPQGYFFYTAYVARGKDRPSRPLTFCFNGGPGSSSYYLHLLTIGPRKAVLDKTGNTVGPPPRLADNPDTWLEVTDIVMVDPIGTGFSRPAPGADGKQFWGVQEDARSVADFIRMYLTENGRWLSPIFIAGESYGGVRGALLAYTLQYHPQTNLNVNGVIFISPAFDMSFVFVRDHDPLGMALYFPSLCTTAWYHKKVAPEYQEDFKKLDTAARKFAYERYLPALLKGYHLSAAEMREIATEMSRLCGLPVTTLLHQKLRITSEEFRFELLKDQHISLDRLDARFKAGTYNLSQTLSPLINHYLREELGYKTKRPYTNAASVFQSWKWDVFNISVLPQLSAAMEQNPHMKILVTAGYFDFACPYFSIDFNLDQLQLSRGLKNNIIRRYYDAGHMVYTPSDNLIQFNNDVKAFIKSTSEKN